MCSPLTTCAHMRDQDYRRHEGGLQRLPSSFPTDDFGMGNCGDILAIAYVLLTAMGRSAGCFADFFVHQFCDAHTCESGRLLFPGGMVRGSFSCMYFHFLWYWGVALKTLRTLGPGSLFHELIVRNRMHVSSNSAQSSTQFCCTGNKCCE